MHEGVQHDQYHEHYHTHHHYGPEQHGLCSHHPHLEWDGVDEEVTAADEGGDVAPGGAADFWNDYSDGDDGDDYSDGDDGDEGGCEYDCE
jgi:hypothetical protein